MKKEYLIIDDYRLDKVWDKIKEIISIDKFDNAKILIDTDDKFPDYITFKNVVILIACAIRDHGKFYPQIFLEEALLLKTKWCCLTCNTNNWQHMETIKDDNRFYSQLFLRRSLVLNKHGNNTWWKNSVRKNIGLLKKNWVILILKD